MRVKILNKKFDATIIVTGEGFSIDTLMAEINTNLICLALKNYEGNKTKAAQALGLMRSTMVMRMKKLGIENKWELG